MEFWAWSEGGKAVEFSSLNVDSYRDENPETSKLVDEDIVADLYATDYGLDHGETFFVVPGDSVLRFEVSAKAVRVPAQTSQFN